MKTLKKLLITMVVIITIATITTMTAHAISLNYSGGSSSNDTGAGATTSGFSVPYSETKKNICGYRFSIVTSAGTPKSGTSVTNVYLGDITEGINAYSSAQRFIISTGKIANKKQLANGTKVSSTSSKQSCDYKSSDCGFYSTLPQNPNNIGSWIKTTTNSYQNLSRIYVLCKTNLANASENDYVLIEPIFYLSLAGKNTAATATELALYGSSVSGGDTYDGSNGKLYNAGSGTLWNLMNYINKAFPNALYVSSDNDVYSAVTISTNNKYTYKKIIHNGYGCSILTVKNIIPIKKVHIAYHPNGGTTNTKLDQNGWILMDDKAYFHSINHGKTDDPYNASTFGLTRNGYQFAGWKVNSTGTILDQNTEYASTEYTQYNDRAKTTANTNTVYCHLIAVWEKNTYTNTIIHWKYVGAGGDNSNGTYKKMEISTFEAKSGSTTTIPSDCIKTYTGYYNTGSAGSYWGDNIWTSKVIGTTFTQPAKSITMEYYYRPKTLKVIFHKNDGSGNIANQTFTYGESGNKFGFNRDGSPKWGNNNGQFGAWDRPGYTLLGWSETSSATSQTYSIYSTVSNSWINNNVPNSNASGTVELYAVWKKYDQIVIVPIAPNAPFRENTDVISSFWLVNISNSNYAPSTGAKFVYGVYNHSGQKIMEGTQPVVVPKNDKNLLYFKWRVPKEYDGKNVIIKAHIFEGSNRYNHIKQKHNIASFDTCKTPNTSYKDKAPNNFSIPVAPNSTTTNARWWQWVYQNGTYEKKEFAVTNIINNIIVSAPNSPSAYIRNGFLHLKSGYGFECSYTNNMKAMSGYDSSSAEKSIAPQYFFALFPEYNYSYGLTKCRSFTTANSKKVFVSASEANRQHFTPIYYPDGDYQFQIVLSDCWTPAGMITACKTITIKINGNMYDDWYIGRK